MRLKQQYYSGLFKAGKQDGQGQVINGQPDFGMMMEKCGMNMDVWNAYETKIKANKDLIRALTVRSNSLTTKDKPVQY